MDVCYYSCNNVRHNVRHFFPVFSFSLFDVCTCTYIRRCTKPPPYPRKKDIKNPIISSKKKNPPTISPLSPGFDTPML